VMKIDHGQTIVCVAQAVLLQWFVAGVRFRTTSV